MTSEFVDYERYALAPAGQWGRLALPEAQIDEEILPLVRAMNVPGRLHTLASCAGHQGGSWPYVTFYAYEDDARRLHSWLSGFNTNSVTDMAWQLWADFNAWGRLTWHMEGRSRNRRWFRQTSTKISERDMSLIRGLVERLVHGDREVPPRGGK